MVVLYQIWSFGNNLSGSEISSSRKSHRWLIKFPISLSRPLSLHQFDARQNFYVSKFTTFHSTILIYLTFSSNSFSKSHQRNIFGCWLDRDERQTNERTDDPCFQLSNGFSVEQFSLNLDPSPKYVPVSRFEKICREAALTKEQKIDSNLYKFVKRNRSSGRRRQKKHTHTFRLKCLD